VFSVQTATDSQNDHVMLTWHVKAVNCDVSYLQHTF